MEEPKNTGVITLDPKELLWDRTFQNIRRERVFTASYLSPSQVLEASLAAAPCCGDGDAKPSLGAIGQFPAETIDGVFVDDSYFYLECELDRVVEDLGANSLIT